MSEVEEKQIEEEAKKPKLELLELAGLSAVDLCNPIKDKINQIKVCYPNIDGPCKPYAASCSPVCIPAITISHCDPLCNPVVGTSCDPLCNPTLCIPAVCLPVEDTYPGPPMPPPCSPWIQDIAGPIIIEDITKRFGIDKLEEIDKSVNKLITEIEALKKKIR